MKMFVATAVIAATLAGPAYAQMGKGNPSAEKDPRREQAAKAEKEQAAIEKEYNATMERTRSVGPAPKSDPWSRIRPADSAATKR
jgi:hypothetical protein